MFQRAAKPAAKSLPPRRVSELAAPAPPSLAASLPRFRLDSLAVHPPGQPPAPAQLRSRPNRTGLPDRLKSGVEALSGISLDAVKVHYNSPRPARVRALAFAQGRDIHLAPGQERHLPHETWHLVQQAQGRVRPTRRLESGASVNDDAALEREADAMGASSVVLGRQAAPAGFAADGLAICAVPRLVQPHFASAPLQGFWPFSDAHAPPANMGGRVQALRNSLGTATHHERADPAWYHARQDERHAVEGDANTWLRDHGHNATEAQRQQMATHLYDLEDHHASLIDVQRAHGHPLWLPAGTSAPDRAQAGQDWQSVQAGTGNIQIQPAARASNLASIAKLLEQPHGRTLLHDLNAHQGGDANRQIRIGGDWSANFATAGRRVQAGSFAASTVGGGDTSHELNPDRTANVGMGSFVQIDRTGPRQALTGEHGDAGVPMPHYLTLGHELGHARNNLRGQSTVNDLRNPAFLALSDMDRRLWSNPEELQNVTGNENALRNEHGLPRRAYHRPPDTVRATRMEDPYAHRFEQAWADFPKHPALQPIDPSDVHFPFRPETSTPAFYERANATISSLYLRRNLQRGALAIGGLAALGGLAAYFRKR